MEPRLSLIARRRGNNGATPQDGGDRPIPMDSIARQGEHSDPAACCILCGVVYSPATGAVMKRITMISAGLALVAGVAAADAQGIGYAPGVNPSNPQDLTHRSNPQDLTAPGGSNPQDLVRRPPGVTPLLPTRPLTSLPSSRTDTPVLQHTVKIKPKQKPRQKQRHRQRGSAEQR
jgi:hypothetical protein